MISTHLPMPMNHSMSLRQHLQCCAMVQYCTTEVVSNVAPQPSPIAAAVAADEPCLNFVDNPIESEVFPLVYPRAMKQKSGDPSPWGKVHRFTSSRFNSGVDDDDSFPDSVSCEARLGVEWESSGWFAPVDGIYVERSIEHIGNVDERSCIDWVDQRGTVLEKRRTQVRTSG